MPEPLDVALASVREEIAMLRRNRAMIDADTLERHLDRVAKAAEDFTTFLTEDEAMLRSGRSLKWLRARFVAWEAQGNAKRDARRGRLYLQIVVPQRLHLSAAREEGRRAARGEESAA